MILWKKEGHFVFFSTNSEMVLAVAARPTVEYSEVAKELAKEVEKTGKDKATIARSWYLDYYAEKKFT